MRPLTTSTGYREPAKGSISTLPADVLIAIYSYLSIHDQLAFSSTHRFFRQVFLSLPTSLRYKAIRNDSCALIYIHKLVPIHRFELRDTYGYITLDCTVKLLTIRNYYLTIHSALSWQRTNEGRLRGDALCKWLMRDTQKFKHWSRLNNKVIDITGSPLLDEPLLRSIRGSTNSNGYLTAVSPSARHGIDKSTRVIYNCCGAMTVSAWLGVPKYMGMTVREFFQDLWNELQNSMDGEAPAAVSKFKNILMQANQLKLVLSEPGSTRAFGAQEFTVTLYCWPLYPCHLHG
ncbi:hypothetical protein TWF569_005962 [Orbilia oligospora]|nr:hypothetical protein TWF103_006942 [Orbilia oligospora]KAF3126497.1 hypothetical protein TWF594_001084 [Orbilia oligospora]KAF3147850.1 hypothetical protein TWF569_005962 [Orbilia oligospora]